MHFQGSYAKHLNRLGLENRRKANMLVYDKTNYADGNSKVSPKFFQ